MEVAAFAIACLGLVVAALSLGWQIAAWTLEGPRVRVVLRHGIAGRGGLVASNVTESGPPRDLQVMRDQGFHGDELIGVMVTNRGRSKVKVVRFGIEMVGSGLAVEQYLSNGLSSPLPHWIEPNESAAWYMLMSEARALVYASKGVTSSNGGVRGYVELGDGRKQASRASLDVPAARVN